MAAADQHARLSELFTRVMEREPSLRPAIMREICGGDLKLEAALQSLLENDPPDGFLASPEFGVLLESESAPPKQVGPYEIEREIGAGGMGVVYEARQQNPARFVALKILRPGLASPRATRRFEFEAHVLGRLRHPGIAQIHEAGTFEHEGVVRPFVAMELIEGKPVDRYADEAELSVAARLELMASIAEAVHYAHTRGVIHRDLKPANVLVERDGQAKILDFGVARVVAQDDSHALTSPGRLIGTLGYMSPEQIAGSRESIDPRADVYALGVLLYELLTGHPPIPLDDVSIVEVARRVAEVEPAAPSSYDRRLKGDISTITLKSLAKDRERRYQSALELAVDLRHVLANEPISARPATLGYSLQTFARRHRGVVAAVVVALAAIIVGTGATAWQAIAKTHEARKSETVRRFLEDVLLLADPQLARGKTYSLREAVDEVSAALPEGLADHPDVAEELHLTLAQIYGRLAEWDKAYGHQEAVLGIRRDRDGEGAMSVARSLSALGNLEYARQNYDRCLDLCGDARARQLAKLGPNHRDTAYSTSMMGQAYFRQGDFAAAESFLREAIGMQAAAGEDGLRHAATLNFLGYVLKERGAMDDALRFYERRLAIRRRRGGDETLEVAASINNIGMLHLAAGRLVEAEAMLTEALARRTRLVGELHPLAIHGRRNMARVHLAKGESVEAESMIRRVIERAPWSSPDVDRVILARALQGRKALDEAADVAREAVRGLEARFDHDHPDRAEALDRFAAILADRGDLEDADVAAAEAVRIRAVLVGPAHLATLLSRSRQARIAMERDDLDGAARRYEEIERTADDAGIEHWERVGWILDYARCEQRRGHLTVAARLVARAQAMIDPGLPQSHPLIERARTLAREVGPG